MLYTCPVTSRLSKLLSSILPEFAATFDGYMLANRIRYLLCESLRTSIDTHQKNESLLPQLMIFMEGEYAKFNEEDRKIQQITWPEQKDFIETVLSGCMNIEQCYKWLRV